MINSPQDGFFLPNSTSSSSPLTLLINSNVVNHGFAQDSNPPIHPNPNNHVNPNHHPRVINPCSSSSSSPVVTGNNGGTSNTNNKRKRNQPGKPDPDSEVVALSPHSLMATNRFICEICNKGFQRDQNLQLHRRGHNLPWKLKQKNPDVVVRKKVYICPEKSCVHHDPSRALGDLTGIKKHFSRKHGEKKWKCDKCAKKYAVMSDWKAHSKICGTREYRCDCGTVFSRKDSFITHRAFCDALTEERMRVTTTNNNNNINHSFLRPSSSAATDLINTTGYHHPSESSSSAARIPPPFLFDPAASSSSSSHTHLIDNTNMSYKLQQQQQQIQRSPLSLWLDNHHMSPSSSNTNNQMVMPQFSHANLNLFASLQQSMLPPKEEEQQDHNDHDHYTQAGASGLISLYSSSPSSTVGNMSATALLHKAAQIGSTRSSNNSTLFANASSTNPIPPLLSTLASFNNNSTNVVHDHHHHHGSLYGGTNNGSLLMASGGGGSVMAGVNDNSRGGAQAAFLMQQHQSGQTSTAGSSGVGMRDFLGTLGGGAEGAGNNNNSSWPR